MSERCSALRAETARWEERDPSLRTAIRLVRAARQPIAVGWGPGLPALHNLAFADLMGAPDGSHRVGRPMRELCADLWPRLEPLVEDAMRRGEAAVLEDLLFCNYRHGYAEESYLMCSCSPLTDDDGAIAGVMIAVSDSTEHVLFARRTAALKDIAAAAATARSVSEGCRQALAAVANHPADIPFALLYLRDAERDRARLLATATLAPGTAASPEAIELALAGDGFTWPVAAALGTNESLVVDDVLTRFGTLPAGEWPFAPRSAIVVPLTSPGRHEPDAVLVAGVSARHQLDAPYRTFIDLVVKQIAAAIAAGRMHEDEERRATARVIAQLARAKRRARMRALKARFEERTRLARELHDTLLQGVTGIALQLSVVLPQVRTAPDAAAAMLEHIVDLAVATSREARQAVWDMRPVALDENDFPRAVEAAARQLAADAAITVRVSVAGRARPLPVKHQAVVLRIVREAVANAVRHAQARSIRLQLRYGAGRLHVAVTDDGRGFAVETDFHSYEGHWGLLGMQERASGLGGALSVRSAPARGTTVALVLPYRRRARTAGMIPRPDEAESSGPASAQSGSTTSRKTVLARLATLPSEGAPVERRSPSDHRANVGSLTRMQR
jgi:signal transduction histidine kinase